MSLAENQFLLEGRRADITEKQHGVLRSQFFAAHLPKLEIKFVRRLPADPKREPRLQDIVVEFVIINTGSSDAQVLGSNVRLGWMQADKIPAPSDLIAEDVIAHRPFKVGATDKAEVRVSMTDGPPHAAGTGSLGLHLLGWIVYVDGRGEEFGATHTTYFCRQYDLFTERFKIANIPDWEFTH